MTWKELDAAFPYFVFGYGFILTWILNSKWALDLLERRIPDQVARRFIGHKTLGFVFLIIGAVWSIQNLWLSD